MMSEIGSNFWIEPQELRLKSTLSSPEYFGCSGNDYLWMSTGRSATSFVLDTIEKRNPINKVAVIPPFTCHTVIEPFLAHGYIIYTYHVGKDLKSNAEDVLDAVARHDAGVVIFHRYFGVDTINGLDTMLPALKNRGVITIEDCTQNLYSSFKKGNADYYVGSIRKWCGVPDGGFAVCKDGIFENKPTTMDETLQNAKREASMKKYDFLFRHKGEKEDFLNCYRVAEDILDTQKQYYKISDLSAAVQSNLDVDTLKSKRRGNFKIIADGLNGIKGLEVIFNQLKDDEVPLYCPILCDDRKAVQSLLVRNSIYAPVVWPKAESCPTVDKDSDYLYEHILCIPIDQRYDVDDMQRIVSVLRNN